MSTIKESEEMDRKQMGYIKISSKSYPIYEGLNIIGRDLKATVRVSDLKFSKQHAVLSVVDETTYFISDFGSSNGTELKRNKLTPYKFYKIQDREVIIFGDVVGVYHTGVHSTQQEAGSSATQSQVVDHVSSTQLMTQNIHEQTTQPFETTVHNAATQEINKSVNSVSVHDLNTQVLPERPENPECSKSATTEERSQKENYMELSRSEVYDDVFANESFRLSLQNCPSKYDIEVDETLPTDSKLDKSNKSNNDSLDDDDIILSTQDNAMIEKQSSELIKKTADSDSETDIEDEEELMKNLQQSAKSDTSKDNETSKKKLDDSDSETDAEDDLVSKKICENIKSDKVVFSDEEEELDLLAPTQKLQDAEFLAPTQILQKKSVTTENEEEEDDDLLLVPTQLLQNKPENILNESQEDIDLLAPTQLLEKNNKLVDDESDAPTQILEIKSCENDKQVHNENADAPTQLLENKSNESNNTKVVDDDFLAPTQLLENKSNESNNKKVADDDFLAPTQLLQNKSDKNEVEVDDDLLPPTQLLQNKPDSVIEVDDDDDLPPTEIVLTPKLFFQPCTFSGNKKKKPIILSIKYTKDSDTQKLGENKVDNLPTQLLQNNPDNVIEDDDYNLPPTQLLSRKSSKPPSLPTTQVLNNSNIISGPFQIVPHARIKASPLKKSIILSLKTPLKNEKSVNSISGTQKLGENNVPTQLLQNNPDSVIEDDDDDLAPTQLLSGESSKPPTQILDNSIFSAPTQVVTKSSIFSPPKKSSFLSTKSPKNTPKKSVNFSEDPIFDMPTQKLEQNNEKSTADDIYTAPTQLLENKDDNIFDAATQLLDKNKSRQDLNNSNCSSGSEINSLNVTKDSVADLSIKLVLNETDENINKVSAEPETETQLEVDFGLETQKIYVEEKTSRPDNPLGCMFAEQQTQMTEDIVEPQLQVKLIDITLASTSKTDKSDENDFKEQTPKRTRRKRNIEDTVAQNATKLNVTRVKTSDDTKNNNNKQKNKNDSLVKSSETDEEIKPHNTRGKRISYQKLNSGKSEVKKVATRGRTPKISSSEETVKKSNTPKKITENSSDIDDFINRVTRSKRSYSTATPQKNIQIEDSDEDTMPKKKKVVKLQYTDDSEITISNSSSNSTVPKKTRSRSMKIEDYSSDENTNSICLNTPNTKRRKFEPLNVTINSQTSNSSGESVKHKVVFTMLSDTNLESFVKKLGGTIIDSVQSCTVLVTNKISRSLKFLTAVTLGKPIVQSKWISESIKKNIFLDPWNYLLEDEESETKFDFSLKESLKKSTQKKLLADVVVLLATKKNHDVLKELIEISGGKCIQRAPAKNGKAIVVSYEEDRAKYSKYLKQKNLTVVSAEAIFSGILQQEIQWKQHLLS